MKILKKNILYGIIWCFAVMSMITPVSGAQLTSGNLRMLVSGYKGDAAQLRLCGGEDVYDATGAKVLSEDEEISCTFSMGGDGIAEAEVTLYSGIEYYLSDGIESVSFTPDFITNGEKALDYSIDWDFDETDEEDNEEDNKEESTTTRQPVEGDEKSLTMSAQGPSAAAVGDIVKYTVTEVKGEHNSDTFTLQCEIPEGLELISVFTGTYNAEAKLELLCQTQADGKWHMWGENISSLKGQLFYTSEISFADGDRIKAFVISVKEAPKGFALEKQAPMYYRVKILNEKGLNNKSAKARVSAYVGDEKQSCERTFTTIAQQVVQTGDDNVMMLASFILLAVSVIVLLGYITVRLIGTKREERYERQGVDVKFKKDKSAGEGVELTFLKDKNPG